MAPRGSGRSGDAPPVAMANPGGEERRCTAAAAASDSDTTKCGAINRRQREGTAAAAMAGASPRAAAVPVSCSRWGGGGHFLFRGWHPVPFGTDFPQFPPLYNHIWGHTGHHPVKMSQSKSDPQ